MPITYEKIEALFEEKFQEALNPLTKQIEDAMKNIQYTSEKYDEIVRLLKASDEERKILRAENKSLKTKVLESENELKALKESYDDLDQYLRRDCVEIRGLPVGSECANTNDVVLKVAEKIGVDLVPSEISVSHPLPSRTVPTKQGGNTRLNAIIVKFVRRDVKEKFYHARKNLKNLTASDFGYQSMNKVYINENLTRKNKELFNSTLKIKKEKGFKYIWTNQGRIYLRKNEASSPVHIKNQSDLQRM